MIKNPKKIRKIEEIQETDSPRRFPKLSGTKMAKSTFYRHEVFPAQQKLNQKLKTLISAQVHDERKRLVIGKKKRTRSEKKTTRKSLPQKHFAYRTPGWRLPYHLALPSTRHRVNWFLDLAGHCCAFPNRQGCQNPPSSIAKKKILFKKISAFHFFISFHHINYRLSSTHKKSDTPGFGKSSF